METENGDGLPTNDVVFTRDELNHVLGFIIENCFVGGGVCLDTSEIPGREFELLYFYV